MPNPHLADDNARLETQIKVKEAALTVITAETGCDRDIASSLYDIMFHIGFMFGKVAGFIEIKDLLP